LRISFVGRVIGMDALAALFVFAQVADEGGFFKKLAML